MKNHFRIKLLKENLANSTPNLCSERAKITTEAYQAFEKDSMMIKRAKTLYNILNEMTVYIKNGELIVGNQASRPGGIPVFPETQATWLSSQLDLLSTRKNHRIQMEKEIKETLKKILPYWKGKTPLDKGLELLSDNTKDILKMEYPVISPNLSIKNTLGHVVPNYEKVLNIGFLGIKEQAQNILFSLDTTAPESIAKIQFYRSIIISCDAVINFAKRFALKVAELAKHENDVDRVEELKKISEICERVPALPARSFHEALQSFWFIHLVLELEGDGLAISPGRMDQYLYPFYQQDIQKGKITKDDAQELLDCLWIKFNEIKQLPDVPPGAQYTAAFTMSQNIVLGGLSKTDQDSTNDLSYLMLKAEEHIRYPQPALSIRVHNNTPKKFLKESVNLIKLGGGKPAIFNDEIIIASMLEYGVSLEDAKNYAIVGCVEPTPSNNCFAWTNAAMLNLAKCFELALFNGTCVLSEKQINDNFGVSSENCSFDEFLNVVKNQISYFIKHLVTILNSWDFIQAEVIPQPYLSCLIDGRIDKGQDVVNGGAKYNFTGPQGVGLANVADSLAVIKKVVFKEGLVSFEELKQTLKNNFPDESFRQLVLNRVPKYGNDDDYVDLLAKEIADHYCSELKSYQNLRGGSFRPGLYSVAGHVPLGRAVGALPNGKRKGEGLADGISPVHGCDRKGLTSVVKSASKLQHLLAANGTNLNPRIHPSILKSDEDINKFLTFLYSVIELKNMHIQLNVVTSDTLTAAIKNPGKYQDLLVRVSGYSAFFVELDSALQEDILLRTVHNF